PRRPPAPGGRRSRDRITRTRPDPHRQPAMTPEPPCPTAAALRAFHLGDLPEASLDAVADHVAGCPTCETTLSHIEADPDPLVRAFRNLPAVRPEEPATHEGPRRIGHYELAEVVGRGGMGVVYKAWQPDLGRFVAVKLLRAGWAATPDEVARFRREAELLGRVRHPNLVEVYDAGAEDGVPYLVLEFVPGGSLERWLRANRPSPRDAARLVEG